MLIFSRAYSTGEKTLDDYSQANIRLPYDVDDFALKGAEAGIGHQFAFCYGDQTRKLRSFAELCGIDPVDLDAVVSQRTGI